ncbi:MAG: DUF1998 domain-containing protein [Melioribacteraceae bacterium]|nr:DUF1998 domain-containing protein [Melioribacteraceae bacterium]
MAKNYFNHGKNKMLSSYGGVGSLVETIEGSVIIETFDNWGYQNILYSNEIEKYLIVDDRLLSRLKYIFKNLKYIVSVPDEFDNRINPRANYFPKWFYCPNCKQFNEYSYWKNSWHHLGKDLRYFYPPKCSNKDCNQEILEQVRFVMTCPDGHIQDLPWNYWNNRTTEKQLEQDFLESELEESTGPVYLNFKSKCCSEQKLNYSVSRENSELSGIHIECKNCGKSEDLGGVFGFRMKCSGNSPWFDLNIHKNCEKKLKVVIKSSNSIYYSNIISSIYIPVNQINLKQEHRVLISKWLERGKQKDEIIKDLKLDYDIPESETRQYLDGSESYVSEQSFREVEYDYFKSQERVADNSIKFSKIDVRNKIKGFDNIIRIEKLKHISVQTSFTRQMPIDSDAILLTDDEYDNIQYEVKRQSTTSKNINTPILLGVESLGEAILFTIDKAQLDEWSQNVEVSKRSSTIKNNAQSSQRKFVRRLSSSIKPQYLLIHTLSHLIIKELEYVCGYSAASLKERLYIGENMFGFMIMAIEGTEGSLGGLVSQCDDLENLNRIINSAIERAKDCSSDPICENSEGQGVENLNLAACYSCTLLPDISCEVFNSFLDRNILINKSYGFFR